MDNIWNMVIGPNWIPVDKGLPGDEADVLVTVKILDTKNGGDDHIRPHYYVDIAYIIDNNWVISESDELKVNPSKHKVIAWMPLPKPYVEA